MSKLKQLKDKIKKLDRRLKKMKTAADGDLMRQGGCQPCQTKERINIKIAAVGDLMCQFNQQEAYFDGTKFDFAPQFEYVKDIFQSADLTIGNLEANIAPSQPLGKDQRETISGAPYLNGPEEWLETLKNVGFDVLVNANNHNCDVGKQGLRETLHNQDKYGFRHTGIFDGTEEERYLLFDVKKGFKIGIASYTSVMNKGMQDFSQEDKDRYLNIYSKKKVQRDIAAMRKKGADFVLIYLHTGVEYSMEPSERHQTRAQAVADAGADYVICSHTHTVQKSTIIEASDGRKVPVAYSLGNFVSNMFWKNSKWTMLLWIELEKFGAVTRITDIGYYPCRLWGRKKNTKTPYQVIPCTDAVIDSIKGPKTKKGLKLAQEKVIEIVGKDITPLV